MEKDKKKHEPIIEFWGIDDDLEKQIKDSLWLGIKKLEKKEKK